MLTFIVVTLVSSGVGFVVGFASASPYWLMREEALLKTVRPAAKPAARAFRR